MKVIIVNENSNRYRRLKKALWGDASGKIKTFCILSPENPLGWEHSTEEEFKMKYNKWLNNPREYNRIATRAVKDLAKGIETNGYKCLQMGNFTYTPIKGSYGDKEHSIMIFNIPFADAKQIAKSFGQESFFYGIVREDKSSIAYYKTTNACQTYSLIEITETVSTQEEAEDFFSKFGCKFSIDMREFGAEVPEIVNNGEFEESMNDNATFMSRSSHRKASYKL